MATREQDEEEVASGLLRVSVGGQLRELPELKWRANREWQRLLTETFAGLLGTPADTPAGQAAMADAQRSLVLAYDETGSLGDLEDATDRELDALYNRLIEVSFPLASSREAASVMVIRAVLEAARRDGAYPPASSTSSPSPYGATGTRRTSSGRSRSGRSRSTTGRR